MQGVRLTASDGAAQDGLGYSVAVSGNMVAVGARDVYGVSSHPGAVYMFTTDGVQVAKLTRTSLWYFGDSLAFSGDTLVVGTAIGTGACVFVKPAGGWADMTETAVLTVSGYDWIAFALSQVAISGDTVVLGSPMVSIDGHQSQGAAYVFVKPAGGWRNTTETARLTASDGLQKRFSVIRLQ